MRLIDADTLMETIRENEYPLTSHLNSRDNGMFTIGIQQAVDEQPTIEAEPVRHGKWIFKHNPITDPKGYFIRIICSECDLHTGQKSNYCPMCGAKMDGESE